MEIYGRVTGKVQGVMFRQTFIRGALKRSLKAGATNLPDGSVSFVLLGDEEAVQEILDFIKQGKVLNSWNALADNFEELNQSEGIPFEKHQVTTENVDTFNWSKGVEMYL